MRTNFSRVFFPAVIILLIALLSVGASFRALVQDYMEEQAIGSLRSDANTISQLAAIYYTDGNLTTEEFLFNLSIASQVSEADAVIIDSHGNTDTGADSPGNMEFLLEKMNHGFSGKGKNCAQKKRKKQRKKKTDRQPDQKKDKQYGGKFRAAGTQE